MKLKLEELETPIEPVIPIGAAPEKSKSGVNRNHSCYKKHPRLSKSGKKMIAGFAPGTADKIHAAKKNKTPTNIKIN